ncbi:MAG: RdgB/HAM1 family non-canonical purine NTP pyrophosphatase [Ruminococcaceae bacterium]|nr:RdgB/HAM1 family non-canonical purine NTP pyrophosphatase [Oscillospiraceae bacterium]
MQKTFLIATHNEKKKNELLRILSPLGVDVKTDKELNLTLTEAEENGETFYENALIKAQSGCKESGLPCVADDSGLMVDYLAGAPGVYSARFAGEHGNDKKNNEKLLKLLKDVPESERTARFVSVVCCVFPNGDIISARGECEGKIGYEEIGNGGFGYDPIFMVDGKSFGELSAEEKDKLSHRGKALLQLSEKLKDYMSL